MSSKTKQVNKIVVDEGLKKALREQIYYDALVKTLKISYQTAWNNALKEKWILFDVEEESSVKTAYYNKEFGVMIPMGTAMGTFGSVLGKNSVLLSDKEAAKLFTDSVPAPLIAEIKTQKKWNNNHWIGIKGGSYCFETRQYSDWNDDDSVHMTIVRITKDELEKRLEDLSISFRDSKNLNKYYECFCHNNQGLATKEILEYSLRLFSADFSKINGDTDKILAAVDAVDSKTYQIVIEQLLDCDKRRADLESYDKKILDDINAGHWELWEHQGEQKKISISPLIARNPVADIKEDGLVGIDFGTKSTIVSVEDGSAKSTLLRVGVGKLSSSVEKHHYENPTIMEFVNLEQFLKDYNRSAGRPQTSIQDITVSHKANNNLKECTESDYFYSYFYDIKQWCGSTNREIKIIDQSGKERLLPAFVNLKEGEFNPLEIYAYYLGLYINNMRNGIYMEYTLSFPVTYTKEVKQKILESFTKGLKKSLPDPVLNNADAMKRFRVTQGVSEPAAYAITALREYGFEPDEDEDEKIFYGIFDFGGGTTDFDFGVYRCPKETREEERYDYVIEQFGSEGDQYLGGENLLELMAYEIFKANASQLQPQGKKNGNESAGFSFSKPVECDAFPGSETLISNSQEARRNTKQLMEALRPFWEGIVDYKKNENSKGAGKNNAQDSLVTYGGYSLKASDVVKNICENGMVSVDLFDREGKSQPSQNLYIEKKETNIHVDLIQILENRIDRGVAAFFESIKLAFEHHKEVTTDCNSDEIEVFLAGNSSKSPILRKCFEKHIKANNGEIDKNRNLSGGDHFKLYPPLGTEEANAILKDKGLKVNTEVTAPTGKTGVAYGLIAGREGGNIKVIAEVKATEEAKFRYNLGKYKRGKFNLCLDRNAVVYGEWIRFIDAGEKFFEIFFTSMPGMDKQPVTSAGISKKRCQIDQVDSAKDVYIRVVSPEELEYTVAADKPDSSVSGTKIRL